MFKVLCIILVVVVSLTEQTILFNRFFPSTSSEDANLSTPELIVKYGYTSEVHSVTTEDGYILQLHRIAGGPKSPPRRGKKVVFLMHGLGFSSGHWLLFGIDSFAFQMADEGYDVWMGNSRGNQYSTNHVSLKPFGSIVDTKKFWTFSWHEIGFYDLPAMIDYILARTEQDKLQYIGHSQGTTAYFVMVCDRPEYNDKIEKMHALAPIAMNSNAKTPIMRKMAYWIDFIQKMSGLAGSSYIPLQVPKGICKDRRLARVACSRAISLLFGRPTDQLDNDQYPLLFGHFSNYVATNQPFHFAQIMNSGLFRHFDYGDIENQRHYNQTTPPEYNLTNAVAPIAVYYSSSDWVADPRDVQTLVNELPNVIHNYLVPHTAFNHGAFLFGKDVHGLLFNEILKVANRQENIENDTASEELE